MIKEICCSATIASLVFLGACAPRVHEPNETYVLVAVHTRIPYWQEAFAGLRRAGAEMHVKVEMVGPERYDPKGEQEAFEEAVADKPSGILISPADPNLMATDIDSALQAGIPVLTRFRCTQQQTPFLQSVQITMQPRDWADNFFSSC
jgi:ribose transport system substrate-binding protein